MESSTDLRRLDAALTCPSKMNDEQDPLGARELIYQCWAALLGRHLPDRSVINLLQDNYGFWHPSMFMTAEELVEEGLPPVGDPVAYASIFVHHLRPVEAEMYAQSLERSRRISAVRDPHRVRTDIGSEAEALHAPPERKPMAGIWLDDEFDRLTKWIIALRVVEGHEREKHWPPPAIRTQAQLLDHSRQRPTVGWLNIGSDPVHLRHNALGVLSAYFFSELEKKAPDCMLSERIDTFLETWAEVFGNGTFRLGLTHVRPMGVANGLECRSMVYDFDPSSMQFHCFPVQVFPAVRAQFHEGQIDF